MRPFVILISFDGILGKFKSWLYQTLCWVCSVGTALFHSTFSQFEIWFDSMPIYAKWNVMPLHNMRTNAESQRTFSVETRIQNPIYLCVRLWALDTFAYGHIKCRKISGVWRNYYLLNNSTSDCLFQMAILWLFDASLIMSFASVQKLFLHTYLHIS